MTPTLDPHILRQIQAILRRDLKLDADHPMPPQMPFFGGDIDLDSLDMLLVLGSVEREMGVRITDAELGRRVFQTVGTLVQYVQEHRPPGAISAAAAPAATAPIDWLALLPHGPAFRFVTRVLEVQPGQFARGVWSLNGSEPFFAAHFPGRPIVPGVLIAEALAQLSGLAGAGGGSNRGALAHLDVKFEAAAAPPIDIELTSRLLGVMGALRQHEVHAGAGDITFARGTLTLHFDGAEAT
jgi:3-hydroxyacyl-[acyl-carrier-protein] dehydratase